MSRKFSQKSQKTKIIKAKLKKKNDYTSSGFSLLNYVLTISKVFGTSDHLEVLFSKCPKNTTIYMRQVDADTVYREKARRQLHKNAASCN